MALDLEHLRGLSMPRLSWDYEKCHEADHWFLMARAFQECSCHLLGEMIERRLSGTFHHAKAVVSLFEHAAELFLKGGIALAGKEVSTHHSLDKLHDEFKNLYPGEKFKFTGSVDEIVQPSRQTPFNVFARYPAAKSGRLWEGHTCIDLVVWFEQASRFMQDFKRLEPLMKDRYPQTGSAGSK